MEILKTDSVDTAVTTLFGDGLRVTGRLPVYGGDINQSYQLSLSDGSNLFMKCNSVRNLVFLYGGELAYPVPTGTSMRPAARESVSCTSRRSTPQW